MEIDKRFRNQPIYCGVKKLPYLKIKCRDCNKVIHAYFKEQSEMPKVQKGEYVEYFCDFCNQKRLFELV